MISENKAVPPTCPQCGADLLLIQRTTYDYMGHPVESGRVVCSRYWEHYPVNLTQEQRARVPGMEPGGLPPAKASPWATAWKRFERKHFPDANVPFVKRPTVAAVLAPCEALHRKWEKTNARNWSKSRKDGVWEARWTGPSCGRLLPTEAEARLRYRKLYDKLTRVGAVTCAFEEWLVAVA